MTWPLLCVWAGAYGSQKTALGVVPNALSTSFWDRTSPQSLCWLCQRSCLRPLICALSHVLLVFLKIKLFHSAWTWKCFPIVRKFIFSYMSLPWVLLPQKEGITHCLLNNFSFSGSEYGCQSYVCEPSLRLGVARWVVRASKWQHAKLLCIGVSSWDGSHALLPLSVLLPRRKQLELCQPF